MGFKLLKNNLRELRTKDMDRAAFFLWLGASLSSLEDKYPENTFVLIVSSWMFLYEKYIGLASFRSFCEKRKFLKRMGRRQAGLPEHFTGENNGTYKMNDIAVIRRFTKGELKKMNAQNKVGA